MKKVLSGIILFLIMFGVTKSNVYSGFAYENKSSVVLNPLYETYENLSKEDKSKWGVLPSKELIKYIPSYSKLSKALIPSTYNLTDVDGVNYVTPVRNQSSLGLCWTFASNASLESNMLKIGLSNSSNPVTFSERQLDYLSANPSDAITEGFNPYDSLLTSLSYSYGSSRNLGGGGSFEYASYFWSYGVSPATAKEGWETYNTSLTKKSLNEVFDLNNVDYSVTDYTDFPYIDNWIASNADKTSFRALVKEHIMQYGALYVGTSYPNSSCSYDVIDEETKQQINVINWDARCNNTVNSEGTHAMAIIGWNDAFDASYCYNSVTKESDYGMISGSGASAIVQKPSSSYCSNLGMSYVEVKGAWILKNSWGIYNNPYPYLAYDSEIMTINGVTNVVEKDWDVNYDYLDDNSYEETATSFVNTFNRQTQINEKLERITFTHNSQSKEYRVYIKANDSQNYELIGTYNVILPGQKSVDLESKNIILNSSTFKIRIVSDSGQEVTNVNAFTSYVNNNANVKITGITDGIIKNSGSYDYLEYSFIARNVPTGTKITYKLFNSNSIEVSSLISVSNTIFVNGNSYVHVALNDDIPVDNYQLKMYNGATLLDTIEFSLGIGQSGDGSVDNPYVITTAEDLAKIGSEEYYLSRNYQLGNDLDLTLLSEGTGWKPIGNNDMPFTGSFDGNGHIIKGMNINNPNYNEGGQGLFGNIFGATIKNLGLTNINISGNNYVGSVFGLDEGNSTIENSFVYSSFLETKGSVGGIGVSGLDSGSIYQNLYFVGGIMGDQAHAETNMVINDISTSKTSSLDNCWYSAMYDATDHLSIINRRGIINDNIISPKTVSELKNLSTYLGFNFTNVWEIKNSGAYPTLKAIPFNLIADINISDIDINVGTSSELNYTLSPEVPYSSLVEVTIADSTIASYDEVTNTITANQLGSTTLTIEAFDGTGISKTVNLTVSNNSISIENLFPANIYSDVISTITVAVVTQGIEAGSVLNFKVYNSNDVDVSSNFSVLNNNVVESGENKIATLYLTTPDDIAAGTYTLKVYYENIEDEIEFVVLPIVRMTSLSLNKTSMSLTLDEEETLIASILPNNASIQNLTWESSNTDVATVDSIGKVTAIAEGEATITVSAVDGSGKSASCLVTVSEEIIPLGSINFGDSIISSVVSKESEDVAIYYGTDFSLEVEFVNVPPALSTTRIENSVGDTVNDLFDISLNLDGEIYYIFASKGEAVPEGTYYLEICSGLICSDEYEFEVKKATLDGQIFDFDTISYQIDPTTLTLETHLVLKNEIKNDSDFIASTKIKDYITYSYNKESCVELDTQYVGTNSTITFTDGTNDLFSYRILLYGDASGDGIIGANDALLIRRNKIGLTELEPIFIEAGDVNHSGSAGADDALLIRQFKIGMRPVLYGG